MSFEPERFYNSTQALKDIRTYHPDISVDLMRQAGLFAYYSSLLVRAESQHDRISNTIDIVAAKIDADLRSTASASGNKITEGQVKAGITSHPRMAQLQDYLRIAREEVGYLKGVCEALRQRRDTLVQMAIVSREEFKGGATVMGGPTMTKEARHERLRTLAKDDPFIEM